MADDSPYLSVVVVSRNDDHGGNPLQRTQLCINSLYEQCNRYMLPTEFIIVDWNPPSDRPGLADVIQWPEDRRFIRARVITVSPDFHRSLAHSDNLPLFQMIGKNVGIRRACGEYVLATNIDILFSDELMEYLSKRPLEHRHSYRADRFDVDSDVLNKPLPEVMPYSQEHVIRVNIKLGTFFSAWMGKAGRIVNSLSECIMRVLGNQVVARIIDFFRKGAWFIFRSMKRGLFFGMHVIHLGIDSGKGIMFSGLNHLRNASINLRKNILPNVSFSPVAAGISGIIWKTMGIFRIIFGSIRKSGRSMVSRFHRRPRIHPERKNTISLMFGMILYRLKLQLVSGFPFVHMNGCGDFTLLSKEDWDSLGGYFEAPIFSWNVDSLFLIDAYYCDIPEVYLHPPKNTFHVEHGAGSGWTPGKGEQLLFERLEKAGTPYFSWEDCLVYAERWRDAKDKIGYLHSLKKMDYGFIEWNLPERCIE